MLSRPTVFVIGAGASFDFGFPLGSELLSRISGQMVRLSSDQIIPARDDAYPLFSTEAFNTFDNLGEIASRIALAAESSLSIDGLLTRYESHADIVSLGKMAIAANIIAAERSSNICKSASEYVSGKIDAKFASSAGWIRELFLMLQAGVKLEEPENAFQNVRFIVFNYDRSVEFCMLKYLMNVFDLQRDEAVKVLSKVSLVHPYGTIGSLWKEDENSIQFGSVPRKLKGISAQIKTYNESVDSAVPSQISEAFEGAERIVFLGYGFLPENNKLLSSNANTGRPLEIVGTGHKMHGPNRLAFEESVQRMFGVQRYVGVLSDLSAEAWMQQHSAKILS